MKTKWIIALLTLALMIAGGFYWADQYEKKKQAEIAWTNARIAEVLQKAQEKKKENKPIEAPKPASVDGVEQPQITEAVTEYYDNGQKKSEKQTIDGRTEGKSIWWHDNGQKEWEGNYTNGTKNGLETEWHRNGQKKSECNQKRNYPDGLCTFWYENGVKRREETYINTNLEGAILGWYPSGAQEYKGHYLHDRREGLWQIWDEKGVLIYEGYFVDGALDLNRPHMGKFR